MLKHLCAVMLVVSNIACFADDKFSEMIDFAKINPTDIPGYDSAIIDEIKRRSPPFNCAYEFCPFFDYLKKTYNIGVAIETGTYLGDTTDFFSQLFDQAYTIECVESTFNNAKKRFANQPNLTLKLGSSPEVLKEILPPLKGQRILFYLDAHWYADWPLRKELEVIAETHRDNCIIVIDDFKVPGRPDLVYDKYGTDECSYEYIREQLSKVFSDYHIHYLIPKDIDPHAKFLAYPKKWNPEGLKIPKGTNLKTLHAATRLKCRNGWETTDFIWNFSIAQMCDVMPIKDPIPYWHQYVTGTYPEFQKDVYKGIKKGDIVWVQANHLVRFYKDVFPEIKVPFVLVIGKDDDSFPTDYTSKMDVDAFIEDKRIIAIFAQNCNYTGKSKKVHGIPIGIDFHSIAYSPARARWESAANSPKVQEAFLKNLKSQLPPTPKRLLRAFVDFHHYDSMRFRFATGEYKENRSQIFEKVVKSGLVDYSERLPRQDLWITKGQYAFSISPHGNGLDCHRTWEDLALGCIVIVKTSPLDALYKDLPVVIVKDWSEITKENMEKWLAQYGDVLSNPHCKEKLSNLYWWNQIAAAAKPYRS